MVLAADDVTGRTTRLSVLLSPYGGPAMRRVVRVRGAAFCEDQWFAEQGRRT